MNIIKNTYRKAAGRAFFALSLSCMFFAASCTDAWDEHYGVETGSLSDQPSLLENIAADPQLANFYKVVKAIGAEETLASPQLLTLWAPKGLTDAQADSVIAVYNNEIAQAQQEGRTLKWEKNKAVTQFLQNHMALYARPISSLTDSTISMANGKYMELKGQSATSGTLDNNPFDEMVSCGNGLLYKTEHIQRFFPNVREYLEQALGTDTLEVMKFIYQYDEDELDENQSVAGGIKDGETFYLDSVMNLRNNLLQAYDGLLDREDSTYLFVAPDDNVWNTELAKYKQYFQFPSVTGINTDSLAEVSAKLCIIGGRFFNMSKTNKYNAHPQDSLVNTNYWESQVHYPRSHVFYKPFDASSNGLLAGLTKVECSNGEVYMDNRGSVDPVKTFFGRSDYSAYNDNYYEVEKDANDNERMNVNNLGTYRDSVVVLDTDGNPIIDESTGEVKKKVKRLYRYVSVSNKIITSPSAITYTLPSTMSGAYYNVYIVTTPNEVKEKQLPSWFQVDFNEKDANNKFANNDTHLVNPHPVTAGSDIDNADVILAQSNNERCYVASAEKVDTILVQAAMQFKVSSVGLESLDKGGVRFVVKSFGPMTNDVRDVIFTPTLRLNEIILIPFETEAEAKAAADDLDAFNDDILMEKTKAGTNF